MDFRKLAVEGALEFRPKVYSDDRGAFVSPFQQRAFVRALGHPLFAVAQTNHSRSRRGVVRGAHYTRTPPGVAKYVHCARGSALDVVIDVRAGSRTFGVWDAVPLDERTLTSVYFPVGVAHAFVALEDDTVMSYLLSGEYVADDELALSTLDPALDLDIPTDPAPILSERDTAAPTLDQALQAGLLPEYETCQEIERRLCAPVVAFGTTR